MKNKVYEFDKFPDVMAKEQMCKLCHLSKKKVEWLLRSGLVPSENTGKKTRCYIIRKQDIIIYLDDVLVNPDKYDAPENWYKRESTAEKEIRFGNSWKLDKERKLKYVGNDINVTSAKKYYTEKLKKYKDVLWVQDVAEFTGYECKTVIRWITGNHLKALTLPTKYAIPKEYFINFLLSDYYNKSILRKTPEHYQMLWEIKYQKKC